MNTEGNAAKEVVHNKHRNPQWCRKFRRAALAVQFVCSLIKIYKYHAASQAGRISSTKLTTSTMATKKENLLFDVSWFKANNERYISSEVKAILSRPPRNRKPDEIKLAMLALRNAVDTFAEYPPDMQENLAQVGWYESFGPGRVIIRQGHIPQNFYLILSGLARVCTNSVDEQTGELCEKTTAFLEKGRSFGEVAILNAARRNATVVCHNTVSLLAISRQDFKSTLVNREVSNAPEFLEFLRKIDILSGWPLEKIPTNSTVCLHAFFRRNMVISRDTRRSTNIFIIKYGTVQVLKKLTSTRPCLSIKHSRACSSEMRSSWKPRHTRSSKCSPCVCQACTQRAPPTLSSSGGSQGLASVLPVLQQEDTSMGDRGASATPSLTPVTNQQDQPSSRELYINLQTLKAGDVFGLAYILYEETFPMTLVSEGAECILIPKDFLKKHANETYLNTLEKLVRPYPSEQTLQKQLQEFINWKAYKRTVLHK
ncbi:hypothetical protein AAFF_G00188620 [Aldrovandia affinis]|uniref:Cyclic nucleotide-binding domain-containing protein n=1 Tax=Aldrovandia affinis TaxID=143900 RepID=A0AAD7SYB1_9TELE|nr:hypothetical protein AAFF_G00188620 [Aldrovandia affinis]